MQTTPVQQQAVPPKKRMSAGAKVGFVILGILLLPFVFAGLLLLYVTAADFQYDDPAQVVVQTAPMPFAERHSFDAAGMSHTLQLDNADIYWLTEEILPDLHFSDDLYINAYRIALEDHAVYVQGKAFGINVPVKVGFEVSMEDGELLFGITKASLGSLGIPIPIKLIAEKADVELNYQFSLQDVFLLKNATQVSVDGGFLRVTYPVDKTLAEEGMKAWQFLRPATFYLQGADDMVNLVEDLQKHWTEEGYISESLTAYMRKLQADPDEYIALKLRMLASCAEPAVIDYFSSADYDEAFMNRFYPGITRDAVDQLAAETPFYDNYYYLRSFVNDLDGRFGEKKITIRDRNFYNLETREVMDLDYMLAQDPNLKVFFPEGTDLRAIYCEGADARQKIGTGIYSCGEIVKYPNGRCVVMCKKKDVLYITEITAEEYDALASGEKDGFVVEIRDK